MNLEHILDFNYVGLTCNYVGSLENYASRFVILVCCIRRLEKPFDQDACFVYLFMSAMFEAYVLCTSRREKPFSKM